MSNPNDNPESKGPQGTDVSQPENASEAGEFSGHDTATLDVGATMANDVSSSTAPSPGAEDISPASGAPHSLKAAYQARIDQDRFSHDILGLQVDRATPNWVMLEMPPQPRLAQQTGVIHGCALWGAALVSGMSALDNHLAPLAAIEQAKRGPGSLKIVPVCESALIHYFDGANKDAPLFAEAFVDPDHPGRRSVGLARVKLLTSTTKEPSFMAAHMEVLGGLLRLTKNGEETFRTARRERGHLYGQQHPLTAKLEEALASNAFSTKVLGLEVLHGAPGQATLRMGAQNDFVTPDGFVSPIAIFGLADVAGCLGTVHSYGPTGVTVRADIRFEHRVPADYTLVAKAEVFSEPEGSRAYSAVQVYAELPDDTRVRVAIGTLTVAGRLENRG